MLIIQPRTVRKGRRHARPRIAMPGVALVLVEASYVPSPMLLHLYFDREIDFAAIDGSQIVVDDGQYREVRLNATGGVFAYTPTRVTLQLLEVEPHAPGDVRLTASANTGIVAVDDGGTWPGVIDLSLPYP